MLAIFSDSNRFVKDILKSKIQLEPWMHIGIIELDNGKLGFSIWTWDSRQVILESELSKRQENRIRFYISDHYFTNDKRTNDNYLPLKGGGNISKAVSKYFDEHYNALINGIEALMQLSYENAIHELSDEPDKIELVKMVKQILGNTSTHEQRCISVVSMMASKFDAMVAVMVNEKLTKAGLKTNLPTIAGLLQYILTNIIRTMSKTTYMAAMASAGFNDSSTKISKTKLKAVMNEISDGIWGAQITQNLGLSD